MASRGGEAGARAALDGGGDEPVDAEAMTQQLNEHVLPPDVKVVPYYDRQGLIEETTRTVEANLVRKRGRTWQKWASRRSSISAAKTSTLLRRKLRL